MLIHIDTVTSKILVSREFFLFSLLVLDLKPIQFHFHFLKKSEGILFFTFHFSKKKVKAIQISLFFSREISPFFLELVTRADNNQTQVQ